MQVESLSGKGTLQVHEDPKVDETELNNYEITKEITDKYVTTLPIQRLIKEIRRWPLLTREQEIELAILKDQGDEKAEERLIVSNLRLVIKIARDFENLGLPLLDLIQEGAQGLMKGIERYDHTKGVKVSSYVSWWIYQSIKRALSHSSRTIRIPVYAYTRIKKIRAVISDVKNSTGFEPTNNEIANILDIDEECVSWVRPGIYQPMSFQQCKAGNADEPLDLEEVIPDENAPTPFQSLDLESRNQMMIGLMECLTERERDILNYRFGFNDDKIYTLDEVGLKFDLTRERIRQIQNTALCKLRRAIGKSEPSFDK